MDAQQQQVFVEAVAEMRRRQRAWFGGDKSPASLQAAKGAEKRVDELLRALQDPRPAAQGDLFGGGR